MKPFREVVRVLVDLRERYKHQIVGEGWVRTLLAQLRPKCQCVLQRIWWIRCWSCVYKSLGRSRYQFGYETRREGIRSQIAQLHLVPTCRDGAEAIPTVLSISGIDEIPRVLP